MTQSAAERREELISVYRDASVCVRCPLSETRTKVVFGSGDADADLMFVGEGPGKSEDEQGLPFVGRAGQLLSQLLEEVGLSREQVFIANVVKCRPPGNRDPSPDEIESCRPYLLEQVRLIEPKVIATLGNFSTKLLTGSQTGITKVRGKPQTKRIGVRDVHLFPILHPAAALRSQSLLPTMREDFASLRDLIAAPAAESEEPAASGEEIPEIDPAPGDREPDGPPPSDEQLDIFRP